jgi:hypothetical protein
MTEETRAIIAEEGGLDVILALARYWLTGARRDRSYRWRLLVPACQWVFGPLLIDEGDLGYSGHSCRCSLIKDIRTVTLGTRALMPVMHTAYPRGSRAAPATRRRWRCVGSNPSIEVQRVAAESLAYLMLNVEARDQVRPRPLQRP